MGVDQHSWPHVEHLILLVVSQAISLPHIGVSMGGWAFELLVGGKWQAPPQNHQTTKLPAAKKTSKKNEQQLIYDRPPHPNAHPPRLLPARVFGGASRHGTSQGPLGPELRGLTKTPRKNERKDVQQRKNDSFQNQKLFWTRKGHFNETS